jgi:hypothetical protein
MSQSPVDYAPKTGTSRKAARLALGVAADIYNLISKKFRRKSLTHKLRM